MLGRPLGAKGVVESAWGPEGLRPRGEGGEWRVTSGGEATAWASAQLHALGGCGGARLARSDPAPRPHSLGLVLPPYSTFYLQANLSDQILQVKCKWPAPACALHPAPPRTRTQHPGTLAPWPASGSVASCLQPGGPSRPVCLPQAPEGWAPPESLLESACLPFLRFGSRPFSHGFR